MSLRGSQCKGCCGFLLAYMTKEQAVEISMLAMNCSRQAKSSSVNGNVGTTFWMVRLSALLRKFECYIIGVPPKYLFKCSLEACVLETRQKLEQGHSTKINQAKETTVSKPRYCA